MPPGSSMEHWMNRKQCRKQGKMNPGGCLPEVPRNIGCAEEHRRGVDAQEAAVSRLFAGTQNQHDKMSAGRFAGQAPQTWKVCVKERLKVYGKAAVRRRNPG